MTEAKRMQVTPLQRRVLSHVPTTCSLEEACDLAGVKRSVLREWLKDPVFGKELKQQVLKIVKRMLRQAEEELRMIQEQRKPVDNLGAQHEPTEDSRSGRRCD